MLNLILGVFYVVLRDRDLHYLFCLFNVTVLPLVISLYVALTIIQEERYWIIQVVIYVTFTFFLYSLNMMSLLYRAKGVGVSLVGLFYWQSNMLRADEYSRMYQKYFTTVRNPPQRIFFWMNLFFYSIVFLVLAGTNVVMYMAKTYHLSFFLLTGLLLVILGVMVIMNTVKRQHVNMAQVVHRDPNTSDLSRKPFLDYMADLHKIKHKLS